MKRTTYDESRRWVDAVGRPTLRKARTPKAGAKVPPAAVLTVYEDTERGLALLRGLRVSWVLEVAAVRERAAWSVSAKGFVVDVDALPDVCAAADSQRVPYRIKRVRTGDVA